MALVSRSLVVTPRTESTPSAFLGETTSLKLQTVQSRTLQCKKNGSHGVARAVHAAEPVNAIKSVEKAFKSAESGKTNTAASVLNSLALVFLSARIG